MTPRAACIGLAVSLLAVSCGPEQETAHGSSPAPVLAASSVTAPDESATAAEKDVPSIWTMPVPDLAYNARQGRTVFGHYCAPCHGTTGHGDGFNAYNLDPRPRDLSDAEFQLNRTDEDLIAVVRSGGGVAGLSNAMPPWGRTLNERQIRNVVVFLRTLKPDEEE